jgi:histidinol-phosphate aminotransferase
MQRVKIPYSLNRVSERVAIAALQDKAFVRKSVQVVSQGRRHLEDGFEALGLKTYPSEANFILFRSPIPSSVLVAKLAERGVMIRDFGQLRRLEDCVRTTIGTAEMNDLLLAKLKEVLGECR